MYAALSESDLLNRHINAPALLQLLYLNFPKKILCDCDFLPITFHRQNYGAAGLINRMSKAFNEKSVWFDFKMSKMKFKDVRNRTQ